nr:hypothetical protein BCU13_15600 [Vibrio lentus]
MEFEPKWGSLDVQNKLFTDYIKESRSRNATAFLHFRIKITTWSTGSPDVQNMLFTGYIKESHSTFLIDRAAAVLYLKS